MKKAQHDDRDGLGLREKGGYLLAVSLGFDAERYSATALTIAVAATLSRSSRMIDMERLLGGCVHFLYQREFRMLN